MYKDPTEWRRGFKRWKETGESPWKAGKKVYENGRISDEEYVRIMEKVAADNWLKWGEDSEDAALTRILNDNAYDYRGYYSKYPNSAANADTHWSDEFKTVWHPTFSLESTYSGKKSQFNPHGYPGGTWQGEFFNPLWYLLNPHSPGFYKDGYPKLPRFATGTEGNIIDDINNSLPAVFLKTLDPTGISSYYDVYNEAKNFYYNQNARNAVNLGIELFGALPLIGKIGKIGKLAKGTTKKIRAYNRYKAAKAAIEMGTIKGISGAKDGADYRNYHNKYAE